MKKDKEKNNNNKNIEHNNRSCEYEQEVGNVVSCPRPFSSCCSRFAAVVTLQSFASISIANRRAKIWNF